MADLLTIRDSEKHGPGLVFPCGELPADDAVIEAGHEPNGYFWESLASYVAPEQSATLELDCEAGTFAAYGDRAVLEQLRNALAPYVADGARTAELIRRAEDAGFVFDD